MLAVAGGLDRARYDVSVVCGTGDPAEGSLAGRAAEAGIPVTIVDGLQREIAPVQDLLTFWRLFRIIRAGRYQIVHTHISKSGVLGRLAAKAADVPGIVHTYHGDVFQSYFSPGKSRLLLAFDQAAGAVSDRLIEVSAATMSRHLDYGIAAPDRFVVIPNGIDLATWDRPRPGVSALRARLGIPEGVPVIGTVAMLVPVKRLDVLLSAAERVLAYRPDALFVIVGDGALKGTLEAQAVASGFSSRILFLGLRDDVPDLMHLFDLFALSSDYEGFGISLIEAMAAGRPVVATDVGGVSEVVAHGQTGLLVPRRDPDRLADALLALLDSPERRETMGTRGRRVASERYSTSGMVDRVDRLYRDLLREKGVEPEV